MPSGELQNLHAKLDAALAALTQTDLDSLAAFARRRLIQVGLPSNCGEDLAQHAILRVAIGRRSRSGGRHPRIGDLTDHQTFCFYLRTVIRSLVETQRAALENQYVHAECHDGVVSDPPRGELRSEASMDEEIVFRDLSHEMWCRLQLKSPPRLHGVIGLWREQQFDCDVIPINGHHRRLRAELRTLAAKVMIEIVGNR